MSPPRNRFQIHLSTAIVLMFVAGGLIWANTRTQTRSDRTPPGADILFLRDAHFGWPEIAFSRWDTMMTWGRSPAGAPVWQKDYAAAGFNLGVALAILSAVGVTFEWLIRRRDARKGT